MFKFLSNFSAFLGPAICSNIPNNPNKTVITKEIAKSVEADLIICGATGHTPVARYLIGSVSEAIVRSAKCDVLVIRTPGSTI